MIHFFFENIDAIEISNHTKTWLEHLLISENRKLGTINYIFCDDAYLLTVNQTYLNHDYYTDIITFDYVKGKLISGDIFVSLPRITENAQELSADFHSEFHRVLAHGLLHLCGFKDKTPEQITEMRMKEDLYLSKL